MKTTATKKSRAQNRAPKTNASKKPTKTPTKSAKGKAKHTTATKTNTASKTDSASKPALSQAKAIEALRRQVDVSQRKLASLINSTVLSLEKSLQTTKAKFTKLAEQEKKNKATLKTCQAKHKTKPTASTEAALKKAEQMQRDIATAREQAQVGQTALLSQLRHYQSLAKECGLPQTKVTLKSAAPKPSIHKATPPAPSKKPAALEEVQAPQTKEAQGVEEAPGPANA